MSRDFDWEGASADARLIVEAITELTGAVRELAAAKVTTVVKPVVNLTGKVTADDLEKVRQAIKEHHGGGL